ncbi:putative toxin-antitoxin system toxin component, PIN family [Deinococcus sp.]|uniref:putative toxin-antitoxin system toxin component, PIN family n=1 Tax=Deinococcus sp. TaxID=47478 RepID=UPI0026007B36|nr:putative toxin-antitoxin system toxin component, PIN family [Deinococcus sp.]
MTPPLRLVVDIQVLLSGVTSPHGPAHDLWQAALRFDVVLVLAEGHFSELVRVLTYPQVLVLGGGKLTPSLSFQFANQLFQVGEYYPRLPASAWPSCPDPKDWYLLDLLVASGADALISKDRHLLKLREALGLMVLEPRELLRHGFGSAQ